MKFQILDIFCLVVYLDGKLLQDSNPTPSSTEEIVRRKRDMSTDRRRLVATILDECHTPGNRERYIEEMRKADLEVQVYGK